MEAVPEELLSRGPSLVLQYVVRIRAHHQMADVGLDLAPPMTVSPGMTTTSPLAMGRLTLPWMLLPPMLGPLICVTIRLSAGTRMHVLIY
jgi:hypothetical protein